MVTFQEMLRILAGEGGTAVGRFVCFAPFQQEDADEAATYVGEAGSLAGAFELLAATVAELVKENYGKIEPDFQQRIQEDQPEDIAAAIRAIRSPQGVLLAGAMLGYHLGCYEICNEASDLHYVLGLLGNCSSTDHVFAAEAAPPHQDAAFAILEIKPEYAGVLSPAERALAEAAEAGDLAGIARALEAGARVSAADERGMSALHRAVARTRGSAVRALLAAGADPRLGADEANAPMFAAVQGGLIGPFLSRIGGPKHLSILGDLLGAGASLEDLNGREEGLADIARATSREAERMVARLGPPEK